MSEWQEVPLMDLCNPKQWPTISGQDLTSSGFPVFGANGRIGFYSEYNHEEPTLLLTCRGATCGLVNICDARSYVTGNAMALDDLDTGRADFRFMYHALVARGFRDTITGTAQPQITRDSLRRVTVRLPPLPEQRRIADILDKADAIRRKRKEAIALTEELLRSAFLEMFGDPVTNPKGWDVKPFDSIVRDTQLGLVRAAAEQGEDRSFPYVRMNAIRDDGHLDLRKLVRVDASDTELRSMRLREGDFLFNTRNSRELVGKAAVFHATGDYLFNNNIMRVRFVDGVEPDFVCSYWLTSAAQRELESRKAGTTSVFAIYYKSLATLPVPVPPPPTQKAYAKMCGAVRACLKKHHAADSTSRELFDSLVHRAFRGELTGTNGAGKPQLGLFNAGGR